MDAFSMYADCADDITWPGALAIVATCAVSAFLLWLFLR